MAQRSPHARKAIGRAALLARTLVVSATCAALAVALPVAAHAFQRPAWARAARSLSVNDTAHLHLLKASGSRLLEEGPVSGALPGHTRAQLTVGATFGGTITIYAPGGTLSARGSATPHGSGRYESFSGSITVTHGTGRYAHAHGHGGMYGTFDRQTYAFVIHTTGNLTY